MNDQPGPANNKPADTDNANNEVEEDNLSHSKSKNLPNNEIHALENVKNYLAGKKATALLNTDVDSLLGGGSSSQEDPHNSEKQIPTFELCRFCYRPAFSNLGQGDLLRLKPANIKNLPAKEDFLKRDLSYLFKNFRTTKIEILPPADEIPLVGSKIRHGSFPDILDESNFLVVHHCCASWSEGVTAKKISGKPNGGCYKGFFTRVCFTLYTPT